MNDKSKPKEGQLRSVSEPKSKTRRTWGPTTLLRELRRYMEGSEPVLTADSTIAELQADLAKAVVEEALARSD